MTLVSTLRVYMPAIVLLILAGVWSAGADGVGVQLLGLTVFALSLGVAVDELIRRYSDHRQGRHDRRRHT